MFKIWRSLQNFQNHKIEEKKNPDNISVDMVY